MNPSLIEPLLLIKSGKSTSSASRWLSQLPQYSYKFLYLRNADMYNNSSGTRTPSSNSSMVPHYPGSVARARDRVQALHGSFQQPSSSPAASTPPIPTSRRSNSHRGLPQVAPVASPSDQSGCFYYFSSGSSGRTVQETENHVPNRFHSWNQEHFPSFSLNQVDRDPVWGPFHPAGSGSDTGYRSGSFHQRHGSERMPSQNRS